MTPNTRSTERGRGGRPRKNEVRIPVEEVDRLLVHGDLVTHPETGVATVVYPSYRDIAQRFGVSNSSIAGFAAKHNCLARRADLQRRTRDSAEKKLVARRSEAMVLSNDDTVRIIDGYIVAFYESLEEGRVRCDNPSDLNTLVRLKQLLMGGVDSRQEVSQSISLETLQARHRETMRVVAASSTAERGLSEIAPRTPRGEGAEDDEEVAIPPRAPFDDAVEEPNARKIEDAGAVD